MTAPQFERPINSQTMPDVATASDQNQLTVQQRADLDDAETQARYLAEFNEQMRRRYCPGCGDS